MPGAAVRERLAQDVGQWVTDGLIPDATAAVLRERWDQPGLGLSQIARAFGYVGGLLAFFGLLGFVAALSRSELFGALLLLGCAGGLLAWGIRLSVDPLARHPGTARILLALGYAGVAMAFGVLGHALGLSETALPIATGLLTIPVAFLLAYRYRNGFALLLGLLSALHWVGSWSQMVGRSTYSLEIQDPRWMCVAALLSVVAGVVQQRNGREEGPRFHLVYEAVGLTYLNLSLLILTIRAPEQQEAVWIGVWAVAGISQVLAGARLQAGPFVGFGVTALAVNLYTRYFERFWESMDAGLFFLLGGALLFAAGALAERLGKREAAV